MSQCGASLVGGATNVPFTLGTVSDRPDPSLVRRARKINRVLADHLSTWLFAPSEVSRQQLAGEGISQGVHVVGDIMVDALRLHGARAAVRSEALARHGLRAGTYYLATVHRAENTDEASNLGGIFRVLEALDRPVALPLHPRTQKRAAELGIAIGANVRVLAPQVSLNFGTARGWSYVSGGVGLASIRGDVAAVDELPAASRSSGALTSINVGGGARWFTSKHLAFAFDIRFYAVNPQLPTATRPGFPRMTITSLSAGVALR